MLVGGKFKVGQLVRIEWNSKRVNEEHGYLYMVITDEEFAAFWGYPPRPDLVPIKSIATGQIYNTSPASIIPAGGSDDGT